MNEGLWFYLYLDKLRLPVLCALNRKPHTRIRVCLERNFQPVYTSAMVPIVRCERVAKHLTLMQYVQVGITSV